MSAITPKEKNMLMITAALALYAVAALMYRKQSQEWRTTSRTYAAARKKVEDEQTLIANTELWKTRYARMRELMPVFPYERAVDTHWLNIMDSAAQRNGLTISRRQAAKEVEVGDVYELPIECKDWEGTLESLVRFLYDLNKEGAMLDVRQLFVRPSNRPGFLKGTFTLYCAYMRSDDAPATTPAAAEEPRTAEKDAGEAAGSAESAERATDGSEEKAEI